MKKFKKLLIAFSAITSTLCLAIGFNACNSPETPAPEPHTHDWGEWITLIKETCTTSGLEMRICQTDSTHSDQRFIPPAHDLVSHEGKTATCTTSGWNEYQTCTRCDYTTYEELAPTAHNFVDGICSCGNADYEKFLVYELNDDKNSYSVGFFTEESFMELADKVEEKLNSDEFQTQEELYEYVYSLAPVLQSTAPLTIPATYNDLPVTAIRAYGFSVSSFESVIIPDTVKTIGDYAFGECSSLTSITIPNSVTAIGNRAFYWCKSLTSVIFESPNGWAVKEYETEISATDLADPTISATYLKSWYCEYYWFRD